MRLIVPQPGEKWVRKGARRDVIVVGVLTVGGARQGWSTTVEYKYVAGFGGSGIWKRNVVPTQTASLADWNRLFTRMAA